MWYTNRKLIFAFVSYLKETAPFFFKSISQVLISPFQTKTGETIGQI